MLVNAGSVVRRKWEDTLFRESVLPIVLCSGGFSGGLRPHELDSVNRARLFAKAASYTRLWIVQTCNRLVVHFSHTKRLERTNGGADFATDTILCPDVRLGPVCSFNSFGLVSLCISNRTVGATSGTDSAFDTSCNIDAVRLFLFSVGGPSRTSPGACLATLAFFRDDSIRHLEYSFAL